MGKGDSSIENSFIPAFAAVRSDFKDGRNDGRSAATREDHLIVPQSWRACEKNRFLNKRAGAAALHNQYLAKNINHFCFVFVVFVSFLTGKESQLSMECFSQSVNETTKGKDDPQPRSLIFLCYFAPSAPPISASHVSIVFLFLCSASPRDQSFAHRIHCDDLLRRIIALLVSQSIFSPVVLNEGSHRILPLIN